MQLGLIDFIEQLDGRIIIEAGVKEWKLNFEAKI